MNFFTVSLFGHRVIHDLRQLDNELIPLIKELIRTKSQVVFLVGRNGEFDEYVASLIKQERKNSNNENCDVTLVLPYKVADIDYYDKYYDGIIIPTCVHGAHYKAAISLKNKWMVEQSDLVVVYVERESGGAYAAMKYAEKQNKRVINLCAGNTVHTKDTARSHSE